MYATATVDMWLSLGLGYLSLEYHCSRVSQYWYFVIMWFITDHTWLCYTHQIAKLADDGCISQKKRLWQIRALLKSKRTKK